MTPIRRSFYALFLSLPAALPSVAVQAQTEPDIMLPSLVVTPDRVPTDADKVTGTVTVITNKEMQDRQLRTATDVLSTVPGISVQQSGGPGTLTSVFVRGSNSNHVLVLIDGVNVADPSSANGAVDFGHFLTENLDRIEVVRGPMSTLYGSQAIGGVINMVTKAGKGPMNGAAFTELGTRLRTNSGGYVRGSVGRFDYNLTGAFTYSPNDTIVPARFWPQNGFVDTDPYRNFTVAGRLGFQIDDNSRINYFGRFIDTQVKYDQVGLEDPNAGGFTQQFFNRVEFEGNYLDGRWKPTVGFNYSTIYRHDQDFPSLQNPFPFTEDAYYNGRRLAVDFKNQINITDNVMVLAGVDYERTWAYSNSDGAQGWGTMAQTGLYAQVKATVLEDLTLSLGGRVDLNDTFGTVSTWRAGATYLLRETDTRFKASYGTAFKAPSLFELYGTGFFCGGNRNIQPEYSRGWEAGVEQSLFNKKVNVSITYFFNTFNNLIECPPPFVSLQNVANAQSQGFEFVLDAAITSWLDFHFDYTYTLARDVDADEPLVRRPVSVFNVRAVARPWSNVRLGAGLLQVNERNDFNAVTGALMQPSPYSLVRLTASYDVLPNVELFARAENVLNRVYEEPEGFQAPYFQAFFGVKAKF